MTDGIMRVPCSDGAAHEEKPIQAVLEGTGDCEAANV